MQAYPLILAFTVLVPLGGGVVGAILGWDALRQRVDDDESRQKAQRALEEIQSRVGSFGDQIDTIRRYEGSLREHAQRDTVIEEVLAQYTRLNRAEQRFLGSDARSGDIAREALDVLIRNVYPVRVEPSLPGRPLIIRTAPNSFRVLFDVPMRMTPRLNFLGLPPGTTAQTSQESSFGFTVVFTPIELPVERFGFEADAEFYN